MSRRTEKVAKSLKQEISIIIQKKLEDPRLSMTTVTAVEVSRDLRHAKAFVSVLGNEEAIQKTLKGLASAAPFIRKEIGKKVKLRCVPEVIFRHDKSLEKGARIENLLRRIRKPPTSPGEENE